MNDVLIDRNEIVLMISAAEPKDQYALIEKYGHLLDLEDMKFIHQRLVSDIVQEFSIEPLEESGNVVRSLDDFLRTEETPVAVSDDDSTSKSDMDAPSNVREDSEEKYAIFAVNQSCEMASDFDQLTLDNSNPPAQALIDIPSKPVSSAVVVFENDQIEYHGGNNQFKFTAPILNIAIFLLSAIAITFLALPVSSFLPSELVFIPSAVFWFTTACASAITGSKIFRWASLGAAASAIALSIEMSIFYYMYMIYNGAEPIGILLSKSSIGAWMLSTCLALMAALPFNKYYTGTSEK